MLRSRVLLLLVAVAVAVAALPADASAVKGVVLKCNDLTVSRSAVANTRPLQTSDPATEAFVTQGLTVFTHWVGAANVAAMRPRELVRTPNQVVFAATALPGYLYTWAVNREADGTWTVDWKHGHDVCAVKVRLSGQATAPFRIVAAPPASARSVRISTTTGKCFGKVRAIRQTWRAGSVTLTVVVGRPALTGAACAHPPETQAARTVKLRRPIGKRKLLDGSLFPAIAAEIEPECAMTNSCYQG